jgi:hypothetical protein
VNSIQKIADEFSRGNVRFHKREESDLFGDAIQAYLDKRYPTSANLSATLYEKIFTTRLANETANPAGFTPSRNNVKEQLVNLLKRESEIIETEKLSFRQITKKLVETNVLTTAEKNDYVSFYTSVRNPVAHGLTLRLFEPTLGHAPSSTLEIDANYEAVFERVSAQLVEKVYELMTVKVLRKQ